MNCLDFRRIRLSDPYTTDTELLAHRSECEACRAFESEIRDFDAKVADALTVEVPEGLAARILLNHSLQSKPRKPTRRYWLSMAASFFLAAAAATYWVTATSPVESLLVEHMVMEQPAVASMMMPVQQPQVRQVLNSVNLDPVGPLEGVQFASTCIIDGELVAHLVVKDDQGEFTLLLIPSRAVDKTRDFREQDWRGVISPHGRSSSIAVMSGGGTEEDFEVMHEIMDKLRITFMPIKA